MARAFNEADWRRITSYLNESDGKTSRATAREMGALEAFGLPQRRDDSLVFASWNIRNLGKKDGHSKGAQALYAKFGARCDLIAIQEVLTDMYSLRQMRDGMNEQAPEADYRILASDVTGITLGGEGRSERLAFIYDSNRIAHTDIASDISFDRSAVIEHVNDALAELRESVAAKTGQNAYGFFEQAMSWAGFDRDKMDAFFDFIRSPHFATFEVLGESASYEVAIANAHLHYGAPSQREKEFFTLLHWIFMRARKKADAPITMILGDLNLDFETDNDARRQGIEAYINDINDNHRQAVYVNFPFLSDHPVQGRIKTNARQNETFDQIGYFHNDPRLPLAPHNQLAGVSDDLDFFDYGMFNFVDLFAAAGVIGDTTGGIDYSKFEFDVSDHMPIWARIPVPVKDQWTFEQLDPEVAARLGL